MDVDKEMDSSGDATMKEGQTEADAPEGITDKTTNAGVKSPPVTASKDVWARKSEEARANASSSLFAKKLGKKGAGLKAFGFSASKAGSAEAASGGERLPKETPGDKPLRRSQFPHRQYCYLTMDLQGGDDGTKTTVAVAEKLWCLLTLLGTNLPGSALVPLYKMSKEAV